MSEQFSRCGICGEPITSAGGCETCRSKDEDEWNETMAENRD